jgi:hypothetical protein
VSKFEPLNSLDGKSEAYVEAYIDGTFDSLMKKANTNDNNTFGEGFKQQDTMSARDKYMQNTLGVK